MDPFDALWRSFLAALCVMAILFVLYQVGDAEVTLSPEFQQVSKSKTAK